MVAYEMDPIGFVRGGRRDMNDDHWGGIEAIIELDAQRFPASAVAGLESFSHLDVVYVFDRVDSASVTFGARHPRERVDWPSVGIFAQRGKARPNRIGVTTCELVGVEALSLRVRGLDAVDATPVLDVKPHVVQFGPRGEVRQPAWMDELMRDYW